MQGQGLTPVYIEREDAPELLITEYMETEGTLREVLKNLEEAGDTERIYRLVSALFRKWCNYVKLLSAESEAMNLSGTGEELYTKYLNSLYLFWIMKCFRSCTGISMQIIFWWREMNR